MNWTQLVEFAHSGENPDPKEGDLRIWWIPQIPGKAFYWPVPTIEEGRNILRMLGAYDIFQLVYSIKPDFANAGGLSRFEDGEWCDVEDDDEDACC